MDEQKKDDEWDVVFPVRRDPPRIHRKIKSAPIGETMPAEDEGVALQAASSVSRAFRSTAIPKTKPARMGRTAMQVLRDRDQAKLKPGEAEEIERVHQNAMRYLQRQALTVSHPNDPAEKEADDMADRVMRFREEREGVGLDVARGDGVQRSVDGEREDEQAGETVPIRIAEGGSRAASADEDLSVSRESAEQIARVTSSGGKPLENAGFFEERMGADFSDVRVHTGPEAAKAAEGVQAKAFTLGRDVVFGEGQYRPQTSDGKRLIAHELTHTLQQGSATPKRGGVFTKLARSVGKLWRQVVQREPRTGPHEHSRIQRTPAADYDRALIDASRQTYGFLHYYFDVEIARLRRCLESISQLGAENQYGQFLRDGWSQEASIGVTILYLKAFTGTRENRETSVDRGTAELAARIYVNLQNFYQRLQNALLRQLGQEFNAQKTDRWTQLRLKELQQSVHGDAYRLLNAAFHSGSLDAMRRAGWFWSRTREIAPLLDSMGSDELLSYLLDFDAASRENPETQTNSVLDAAAKMIGHFAAGLGTVLALNDTARIVSEIRRGAQSNAIPAQSGFLQILKQADKALAIVEAGFVMRDIIRDRPRAEGERILAYLGGMITLAGGGTTFAPTPAALPLAVIAPTLGTYLTILSYQLELVNEAFNKIVPVVLRREQTMVGAANRMDVTDFGKTFLPYSMAVTRAGGVRVFVYVSTLMNLQRESDAPRMPDDIRSFFSAQKGRFEAAAEGAGSGPFVTGDEGRWAFENRELIFRTLYPDLKIPLQANAEAWWDILEGPFSSMSTADQEMFLYVLLNIVQDDLTSVRE